MTPDNAHARRRCGRGPTWAIAFALALSGCSFQLIHRAPPRAEWPDPVDADSSQTRCTDLIGLPIMDTVVAGSFGTLAYIERDAGSHAITVGLGVATLPYVASAIYGYVQTARCRRYKSIFK